MGHYSLPSLYKFCPRNLHVNLIYSMLSYWVISIDFKDNQRQAYYSCFDCHIYVLTLSSLVLILISYISTPTIPTLNDSNLTLSSTLLYHIYPENLHTAYDLTRIICRILFLSISTQTTKSLESNQSLISKPHITLSLFFYWLLSSCDLICNLYLRSPYYITTYILRFPIYQLLCDMCLTTKFLWALSS